MTAPTLAEVLTQMKRNLGLIVEDESTGTITESDFTDYALAKDSAQIAINTSVVKDDVRIVALLACYHYTLPEDYDSNAVGEEYINRWYAQYKTVITQLKQSRIDIHDDDGTEEWTSGAVYYETVSDLQEDFPTIDLGD